MNWHIQRYETVDSTMTVAAPLPIGSVVVADEQTGGIGRHGHSWESDAHAGLYTSIVLPPHPVLTLALGLAAQSALLSVTALHCDIRWPNDLMLAGKKFGGILVQLQGERAVAGVGINTGQRRFPADLAPIATSLYLETGLDFRPPDILDALLREIPQLLGLSQPEIIRRWEAASTWARGKSVQVDLGERTVTGQTDGLDLSGFLRLRRPDGIIETILAGGVRPL